jgi:Flp pilus assembly protein TadD
VVYRLGPQFGADPPWHGDRVQSAIHYARALSRVLPDSLAAPHRLLLGALAMDEGRPEEALELGRLAVRGRPYDPRGWLLSGQALRALGQTADAARALATAHSLDPNDVATNLELGWVALAEGDSAAAARAWRATIGAIRDPATLREMARLFARAGDVEALRALAAASADTARRSRR